MAFANVSGGSIKAGASIAFTFRWPGDPDKGAQFFVGYPPFGNAPAKLITFDFGTTRTDQNGMVKPLSCHLLSRRESLRPFRGSGS
jgi:hypothetical protein